MATPCRATACLTAGALLLLVGSLSAAAPVAICAPQDPCGRLSDLNKEYAELQNLIVQDRAMLEQLGFRANVEQFEREAAYYNDLMKAHPVATSLKDASLDIALEVIKRNIDKMTTSEAASMAATAGKLPGIGPQLADDIKQIAATPLGQARLEKWTAVMKGLGPTLNAFKLGMAESEKDILLEGFGQMTSTILTESAILGSAAQATMLPTLLATEIGIVTPLVWDLGEGWLHWPSVYRLLELNESQLSIANMYSRQMKAHVARRRQITDELKTIDAANCDSTKMVRKPAESEPPTKGKKARSSGARKGNAGAAILLGAGAAAAGVALAAAMVPQTTEASCGSAPTIPSACLGIGRPSYCNSLMTDYSNWCSCMGRHFDTSTGSCR